jgi:hypothetical protein
MKFRNFADMKPYRVDIPVLILFFNRTLSPEKLTAMAFS